ncbi:YopX family protein [Clostridium sp. BNL1100]|uniref:YopX family protein n=1 Tax=Clostridium sp. BNL1100 TaxID=755731 RepID=UPI00024A7F01|nr:YopX family protein [Clostridium sp. BNL1100]AEY65402.1 phage uncharacterized protein TIGR01671 [Clostridium sp. BNL1100]
MREIKFRAVIKATKEVFPVITIWSNSVCLDLSESNKYEYPEKVFLMDEIELLQYTGLHDKNGIEVFEDDIVQTVTMTVIVKFGEFTPVVLKEWCEEQGVTEDVKMVGFYCEGIKSKIDSQVKGKEFFLPSHSPCSFTVISNIHDNPELMKESD